MPKFTKKDYVAVSKVICDSLFWFPADVADKEKALKNRISREAIEMVAEEFCVMFRDDNPNFNEQKFMEACNGPTIG